MKTFLATVALVVAVVASPVMAQSRYTGNEDTAEAGPGVIIDMTTVYTRRQEVEAP